MTGVNQLSKHIVVSAGKWRFRIHLKELRPVLSDLSAFSKAVKLRDQSEESSALEDATDFIHMLDQKPASEPALATILRLFQQDFLQDKDIHSLANDLGPARRKTLLRLSSRYHETLELAGNSRTDSGLLLAAQNGTASILAIFGGQGFANNTCVADLRAAVDTYGTIVADLVDIAARSLKQLSTHPRAERFFTDDEFDLQSWLEHPASTPGQSRLAQAPISFPLLGLLSFIQYTIALRTTRSTPSSFRKSLKASTGHSQGVLAAAVISVSDTWADFMHNAILAIETLFWIGIESHYAAPVTTLSSRALQTSQERSEGRPSHMLSVRGLIEATIRKCVETTNRDLPADRRLYIALKNNATGFVVAGPPQSLLALSENLHIKGVAADFDQSRVPHNARKPTINCTFLPISAPFHSPYLVEASQRVLEHLEERRFVCSQSPTTLIDTSTGQPLIGSSDTIWLTKIVRLIMVEPVDWPLSCFGTQVSHIVDFGPGKCSTLFRTRIEGSCTKVVLLSETQSDIPGYGPSTDFYTATSPIIPSSWKDKFQPQLSTAEGRSRLDTRMTKMLGVPPVMVAGMTPTTVSPTFVAAILKAGYHAELAGGGYTSSGELEQAIRTITSALPLHRGLTCNIIYVNPRAIAWQIPLFKKLIAQGVRIDGLTVGGGVPSVDIANEWIQTLGLKHISFKPGSIASIKQVIEIADQNPHFAIGLQWTGGRAGGHHSYEDSHEPMIMMYGEIRRRQNIVLIAGGGFGDAESFAPYFTGQWSASYDHPWMPFDGVLLGSRVMSAKEARTSDAVKDMMVRAAGCSDEHWHQSYVQAVGGVITVLSEMGQPIHVLSNRAMSLWKDLDDRIFSIKDSATRLKKLTSMRQSLIARLNSDYAKPWFATTKSRVTDLEEMTYSESVERLVELMYVQGETRWIDPSYRTLCCDWTQRVAQRLSSDAIPAAPRMETPISDLDQFLQRLPAARTTFIYPDDVSFFMNLCRRRGQKPVNFIPRLDTDFENWFKKDSLWQSEDIAAVPDQDPERVCIIYGPVAAQYTKKANEPVAFILDTISAELTDILASDLSLVEQPTATATEEPSYPATTKISHRFTEQDLQAKLEDVLSSLLPPQMRWAKACLLNQFVLQEGQAVRNPIRSSVRPQLSDELVVAMSPNGPQYVELRPNPDSTHRFRKSLRLEHDNNSNIRLILASPTNNDSQATLILQFAIEDKDGALNVSETTENRDDVIRNFYAQVWGCDASDECISCPVEQNSQELVISSHLVNNYLDAIGPADRFSQAYGVRESSVPMDLCIVIAWQSLMTGLLTSGSQGNIFRLLHRSAEFEYQPGQSPLCIGDRVSTMPKIVGLTTTASGRSVSVQVEICRSGQPVVSVSSEFFIQGKFKSDSLDYSDVTEPSMALKVDSTKVEALLRSRKWLRLQEGATLKGADLLFDLQTVKREANIVVTGTVKVASDRQSAKQIGVVHFERSIDTRNPVLDFLRRHGSPVKRVIPLEQPGWHQDTAMTLQIPEAGGKYSQISRDTNPIHTCPYFAGLAGLERPITHGMFTSAAVRRLVEQTAADADCTRFRRWSCSFDAMVLHGQTIEVKIEHQAMVEGRMLLRVTAFQVDTKEQVLHAEAEIEQSPSAYIFCGQGSQEKGMGMSLYSSSPIAKEIWDRGNNHLQKLYGFSLIDIVREDPKEITIHFGGKRGRAIKQNYLSITRNVYRNGQQFSEPVLVGLSPRSTSYTFSDSRGLLFSTQFAQPALTLLEIAESRSLEATGAVQQNTLFAGHSLGEYSALGSRTSFMALEELLDLVFYRGLIMQRAVERDEKGQTEYSMLAVNPSRVGPWFDEAAFKDLVSHITASTGLLLEIVNWNVEGQQYVCAGSLRALLLTTKVCEELSKTPFASTALSHAIVQRLTPSCLSQQGEERLVLPKSVATTPLSGIDVPFHSTVLRGGIDGYRAYLKDKIDVDDVVPEQFINKWIPNVVGKPFSLDREFVEEVQRMTGSEPLRLLLDTHA